MDFANERRVRGWSLLLSLCGLVVVVGGWALTEKGSEATAAPAPPAGVLAAVGDAEIRQQDVESAVANELADLERQRHEILERGVQRLVNDKLLELEAAARGLTSRELVAQEVEAGPGAVSDSEVDAFYEARKDQIEAPKAEVAEQIRAYLAGQRQQERFEQLLDGLRRKYPVRVFLEPLRVEVAAQDAPSRGTAEAPVTIVEFSDFQCPYCSRVVPTLRQVEATYGGRVRLVFRQFPLPIHAEAWKAAEAALCADAQGRFWELHDLMFAEQGALEVASLKEKARRLGLDAEAFDACLDSGRFSDRVTADLEAGRAAGVTGTPAMFVNGRFISGAVPYQQVAAVIDDELARRGVAAPHD